MRWRSFVYLGLAVGGVVGAYALVWMPCLGSMLALAAITLGVTASVSAFRARGAARRANEPSSIATTGLLTSAIVLPIVAVAALACATLNVAVTGLAAAATIAPAAVPLLLPRGPGVRDEDERGRAASFWNGGYAGDWLPTDVGEGEDEGDVRRTIRVGTPFVVLAVFVLAALVHGDEAAAEPATTSDPPDGGV